MNIFNDSTLWYIITMALQLAGAIILMVSFWGSTEQKVIDSYYGKSNFEEKIKDGKITLEKGRLRDCAYDIYLNRIAFLYIVSGYLLNVFASLGEAEKTCIIAKIFSLSVILVLLGRGIAKVLSKIVYRHNKEVDTSKIKADIMIVPSSEDIDEICQKKNIETEN